MSLYLDSSFLVAAYSLEADSEKALALMQSTRNPLPFTPLHRHELRTALRLRVFRGEITVSQRQEVFLAIESDLSEHILVHTAVPWTDAFREAEILGQGQVEKLGVRSIDLLHVGVAMALKATTFLTFDLRQKALAKAAGLKVGP